MVEYRGSKFSETSTVVSQIIQSTVISISVELHELPKIPRAGAAASPTRMYEL
jgi:hypothetical protein